LSKPPTVCLLTDECVHVVSYDSRGHHAGGGSANQQPCPVPDSLLIEHKPAELAAAIVGAIEDSGARASSVSLVIPLHWCFTQVLAALPKRATPAMLSFKFEEYLPVALEDLTCDFMPIDGGSVLAVAVPTEPMKALLAALSNLNVEVECIAVDAITGRTDGLIDGRNMGTAIVDVRWTRIASGLQDGKHSLVTSFARPSKGKDLRQTISEQLQQRGLTNGALPGHWQILDLDGTTDSAQAQTNQTPKGQHSITNVDLDDNTGAGYLTRAQAVEAIARPVALGKPGVNLRMGALAAGGMWDRPRRLATQCLLCLLALAVVLTAALHLHTRTLRHHLDAIRARQLAVYREVFPNADRLPPGSAMRLTSQRMRLEGLTHTGSSPVLEGVEQGCSPVGLLRDMVAGLPADVRIMLLDATIDARQLTLHGHTTRHRDAELIAEAIGRIEGLTARPPRTTRLKTGGVEFTILATLNNRKPTRAAPETQASARAVSRQGDDSIATDRAELAPGDPDGH